MRSILTLVGILCVGPALPSALAQTNTGLLPAGLVVLTPTNQTTLVATVTLTNAFQGPVEGRVYVMPSTNHAELSAGVAVLSWSVTPEGEVPKLDLPMRPMMIFRYGLGTKFEIEGGGKSTVTLAIKRGLPATNGMCLVVQYLPPNMKETNADWSKCRVLLGTVEGRPSRAAP